MEKACAEGKSLTEALADALAAAEEGNEAAKQMKAEHGRAAVFQDQTIGKEDAGAYVGVLIIRGFASAE